MEYQEDPEDDKVDTSHCPVCGKKCKKLLLHLNKAENCKTNVCPDFHLKLQQMSARKRGRKVRENVANWRKANLDKARENMAKWRKSNPVKATEQSRESVEKKRAKYFEEKRKKEQQTDSDDSDSEDGHIDTSHCPVCGKKCKKLLLHLHKAENCKSKVCPDFHLKLQKVSIRSRERKVKDNVLNWREENKNKKLERRKQEQEKYPPTNNCFYEKRKQEQKVTFKHCQHRAFIFLVEKCFLYLSQGLTPRVGDMNWGHVIRSDYSTLKYRNAYRRFVEEESFLNEEETHLWLKEINAELFEAVISLQSVVLIPKSDWLNAIKTVNENENEILKVKLFTLIGKLQARSNENTMDILIPKKYEAICYQSEATRRPRHLCMLDTYILKEEVEVKVMGYIHQVLGDEFYSMDAEFLDLLQIKDKMESLCVALAFARHKV